MFKTARAGFDAANLALDSGKAAEVFARMVSALGGPKDFVERAAHYLPSAPIIVPVKAERDGFVSAIATRDIGLAVVALGGGRTRPQDPVDHAVGFTRLLPVGAEVKKGEPLGFVHARTQDVADAAAKVLRMCYRLGASKPARTEPVIRRIEAKPTASG